MEVTAEHVQPGCDQLSPPSVRLPEFYRPAVKMHQPCAMLENLWDMNDVGVSEGRNGTATAADREAIRVATAADREGIRALVNQAFEVERFLKKGGGDRLQNDGEFEGLWERGTFLVADPEDGALAGCVYVEPRGGRAYLGLLSITPARQGAGLGKQLNRAAEQYAREQGCRWMDLRVVSPRAELLVPLYQRLGYVETGTEEYPAALVEKMTIPGYFINMTKQL
jgi:GNAT superfamily N-acetyltransferase